MQGRCYAATEYEVTVWVGKGEEEKNMPSHSPDAAENKPPALSSTEIDDLLSKTLIANLATIDEDGGIHLLPMWFLRMGSDICIPT